MKFKRTGALFLLCCQILFFFLSGCSDIERTSSYISDSLVDQSSSAIYQSSSESNSRNSSNFNTRLDTRLYELSYDDYFAHERIWVEELSPKDSEYHYEINSDGTVTRFIFSGYGKYGNSLKAEETIICKGMGFVNDLAIVNGKPLFIVDNHKIIQTNSDGEDRKIIYEDTNTISQIRATRELIYFVSEGSECTLCRLHRQSGRIDEMFTTKDQIHHYYALSNYAVRWYTVTPEFVAFKKTGLPDEEAPSDLIPYNGFLFNSQTKENRKILDSDYDDYGFFIYNIQE